VHSKHTAYIGLLLVAATWGFNFGVSRFALNHFDEALFVFIRFGLSVPLLFALLWRLEGDVRVSARDAFYLLLIGLIGVPGLEMMVTYSIRFTTLANASLLNVAPWPIFAALLTPLFAKEAITRQLVIGGLIAMLGVVFVIAGGEGSFRLSSETLLGDLLALGSSLVGALYNVACMPLMKRYSPLKVSAWVILFGSLLMIPLTLGSWQAVQWSELGMPVAAAIAYNVLICTVTGFIVWNSAMRQVGAARANFFRYLVPAAAIVAGYVFFQETMTLWQIFGGLLMAFGLVWIGRERGSVRTSETLSG
jgi:drug/metabolite transporter (DMT)-like permease